MSKIYRHASVVIAGRFARESLELSYVRAFTNLGLKVTQWDMPSAIDRFARLGRVGRYVNHFWPAEVWTAKANGTFLDAVLDTRPDVILIGGTCHVTAGTLAQIRTALPDCRLVLVWPDPLLNCYAVTLNSIPVYDLIATYSKLSIEPFRRLGARRAEWVPLGFDPELHPPGCGRSDDPRFAGDYDVCFVGNYGPERETAILKLFDSGLRVAVWGVPGSWAMAKDRSAAKQYFKGGPLFDKDLAAATRAAPLSLNTIRRACYPAANMRFFEILGSGGVPLSSACPEMESVFPDRESCIYYKSVESVVDIARQVLKDKECLDRVARNGQARVLAGHTYSHRARQILDILFDGPSTEA